MKLDEYARYDGLGLKELVDKKEISPEELYTTAQSGIAKLNPTLNFFIEKFPSTKESRENDFNPKAPFSGVPFLLKEEAVAGTSSQAGSRLAKGMIHAEDGEFYRRLKKTGVVPLGRTNIPELMGSLTTESVLYGPAKNPWNIEHLAGGSSGGSSAAVAAGIVPMAQSSDGAGSIRVPAHCCGVFGFVPSRGRNPCGPEHYGTSFGLHRNHVTTRTVRDSAAMLDQVHGNEPGALFRLSPPKHSYLETIKSNPKPLKIAFSTENPLPTGNKTAADCVAAVLKAAKICQEQGHEVVEKDLDYDTRAYGRAFLDNWCFIYGDVVNNIHKKTGRPINSDNLEINNLLAYEHSKTLTPRSLHTAFDTFYHTSCKVETFFDAFDAYLSPVCLTPAPVLGALDFNDDELSLQSWFQRIGNTFSPFSMIYNATGNPAMSVPLHQSESGLPIGIQCAGRIGQEATLLQLARQFEEACPWIDRKPFVSLY